MKTLSKHVTDVKNKEEDSKSKLMYDGYLKVKSSEGWEFVDESDCVIIIPHLKDYEDFLLRQEYIPPYKTRDNKSQFLTVVSGTIDPGEEPLQTVVRELEEETGMRLVSSYSSFEHFGTFFMSKGNSAKYHIYYLPLYYGEYTMEKALGDGSESEAKSSTIKVNHSYLDSLNPSDTITALCIEIMKSKIK